MVPSPAGRQGARAAAAAVGLYQRLVAPALPAQCRFHPSCSAYAREALLRHGLAKGLALASWRLLRCNPWHPGGLDPVP